MARVTRPDASDDDPTLRLYAIVRGDLAMTPGKLAAQAGHAFLGAFLCARRLRPEAATAYRRKPPGTKVVLTVDDLAALERLERRAGRRGLPLFRVVDRGHVHGPDFDGSPVPVAVGLGPATREEVRGITDDLALVS